MLKSFLLVLVRFSGLLVSAPVLGSRSFPAPAKAGLAALTAVIVTPLIPASVSPLPDEVLPYALMAIKELLVGLLMGFAMTVVFAAIQVAGEIMDTLTGFSVVNVFNPALETQVPILGFFYYIVAVLYLFSVNGHHMMIRALVASFEKIPLGGLAFHPELFRYEAATLGSVMFHDGLLIAAPVAGALLLAYVTMGLLGRVVPQIHLFVVGFPITVTLGLLVVAVSLRMYLGTLDRMFYRMFENVETLIRGLS